MKYNTLKDAMAIDNTGTFYSGPCPMYINKSNSEDMCFLMHRPWIIEHPKAQGVLWKVRGLESHAIAWISEGHPIAIKVVPWGTE